VSHAPEEPRASPANIALAHALLSGSNHLGTRPTFIIGLGLVVVGLPFLASALRSR
jgi:hypothetical protein